jgi:biotin transport system substrate-specific component
VSSRSTAVPKSRRFITYPTGPGAVLADALPGGIVRDVLLSILFAAFIGLSALVSVHLPFTPVPVTLQTFAVLGGAAALGWRRALNGALLYAIAGLAGVPWFANGTGGLDSFGSASFGYVLGFVVASLVVGGMAGRGWDRTLPKGFASLVVGDLIVFAFGLPWLMATLSVSYTKAISLGFTPFALWDGVKILLASGILTGLWALLRRRRDPA